MDKIKLMHDALIIAQSLAPEDTGNLKYNAINVRSTINGFVITYDTNVAPYIAELEDGPRSRHRGFIANTGNAIINHINSELAGLKTNINDTRQRVIEGAKNNPARMQRLLDSFNGDHLQQEEDL